MEILKHLFKIIPNNRTNSRTFSLLRLCLTLILICITAVTAMSAPTHDWS